MSVTICKRNDAVYVTYQDYLDALCDTRRVVNLSCYPRPRLTITFCCPAYLIPTEIKFGMIFDKIDVVNKALPYVIISVARIVTILSFLCCCAVAEEFLTILIWSQFQ